MQCATGLACCLKDLCGLPDWIRLQLDRQSLRMSSGQAVSN